MAGTNHCYNETPAHQDPMFALVARSPSCQKKSNQSAKYIWILCKVTVWTKQTDCYTPRCQQHWCCAHLCTSRICTCASKAKTDRVIAQVQAGLASGPTHPAQPLICNCDFIVDPPLPGPNSTPAPSPGSVVAGLTAVTCHNSPAEAFGGWTSTRKSRTHCYSFVSHTPTTQCETEGRTRGWEGRQDRTCSSWHALHAAMQSMYSTGLRWEVRVVRDSRT